MTIGHWANLTEVKKLTQSQLIPGVIEEDIKRNNLIDVVPVAQARGQSIKWNREVSTLESAVANVDIGAQLTWSSDVTYDQQEVELKRKYIQRVLDDFIPDVYGTINDYEAQKLIEMKKGMVRRLGDDIYYDDLTYGTKEFDGLHALAAVQTGTDLDQDATTLGLSLNMVRKMIDAQKHGLSFISLPFQIGRRMDAAYQEAGFAQLATGTAGNLGLITYGVDEMGKRVMFFDSVPMRRTDFLKEEQESTGAGSNARAAYTSGTKTFSVFGVLLGDVFNGEPGLTLGFGNTEMLGQFYKIVPFDALEDYDAGGLRLVSYIAPLLGSKLALARIYDITDVAVLA